MIDDNKLSLQDAINFLFNDTGYVVDNQAYIQISGFTKHQNPHMREAASSIPVPNEHRTSTVLAPDNTGTSPADSPFPLPDSLQEACASSTDEAPPTRNPPIPYQVIADAFNLNMERLPKVRELNAKRKTLIRTAWQENAERRTPEFWTAYFEECASDSFLNGSGPYKNGHENWRPSFDYLLKGDVVTRVFEKALDRMEREG